MELFERKRRRMIRTKREKKKMRFWTSFPKKQRWSLYFYFYFLISRMFMITDTHMQSSDFEE